MSEQEICFTINSQRRQLKVRAAETLLELLRERLNLTGTKKGCEKGDCGACTVILDGQPVNSCLVLAVQADGKDIVTIEGVATGEELHSIQQAFIDHGAVQCGFCTPGMVLTAKALLDRNQNPSDEEIRQAIAGNLCRCTGYIQIIDAIKSLKPGD